MTTICPAFPMRRESPLDPPACYADFRHGQPVIRARLWNGTTTWLITRYADVRQVLGDSARFSTIPTRPGYPMLAPGRAEFLLNEHPTFQRMDPPEHGPFRRMLNKDFTVRRIEGMREKITEVVDGLLDNMAAQGNTCDLVNTLALPMPTVIISDMLGIPYEDHEFIQERGAAKLALDGDPGAPAAAQRDIIEYMDRLLKRLEASPRGDGTILDRLVSEQILPGHLSHMDAVAIAELLIVAGHETTANMVALGALALLQHPDQLARLRADPSLMGRAVEEMLRYLTITHFNGARVALEDVVIGGQQIQAGEGVWALLPSANRDEKQFPDPDAFDITRQNNHHLTFGFGVHQCLGQGLARLELEIAFSRLLARFPNLQLAVPFEQLPFKHDSFIFGVKALPVSW